MALATKGLISVNESTRPPQTPEEHPVTSTIQGEAPASAFSISSTITFEPDSTCVALWRYEAPDACDTKLMVNRDPPSPRDGALTYANRGAYCPHVDNHPLKPESLMYACRIATGSDVDPSTLPSKRRDLSCPGTTQ